MKHNRFRILITRCCCLAVVFVVFPGCSGKTKTPGKTTVVAKDPSAKHATLFKNAKQEVVAAEFHKAACTDEQIAELGKHPKLHEITFYECPELGRKRIESLEKIHNLTAIHFVRCPIDDDGLAGLSKLKNIAHLILSNSEVTAKGIASLRNLPQLKRLTLNGKIKSGAIAGISSLDQLERLDIALHDFEPRQLAGRNLSSMRVLSLTDTKLSDDDLSLLPAWKSLEVIEFLADNVTDRGVARFKKFPALRKLDLSGSKVTDAGLSELRSLKTLESLTLDDCRGVTNTGLSILAGIPALKRLSLVDSGVTGGGLMKLLPSRSLRHVRIGEKKSSTAEVKKLADAMPSCRVERFQQRPGPMGK